MGFDTLNKLKQENYLLDIDVVDLVEQNNELIYKIQDLEKKVKDLEEAYAIATDRFIEDYVAVNNAYYDLSKEINCD